MGGRGVLVDRCPRGQLANELGSPTGEPEVRSEEPQDTVALFVAQPLGDAIPGSLQDARIALPKVVDNHAPQGFLDLAESVDVAGRRAAGAPVLSGRADPSRDPPGVRQIGDRHFSVRKGRLAEGGARRPGGKKGHRCSVSESAVSGPDRAGASRRSLQSRAAEQERQNLAVLRSTPVTSGELAMTQRPSEQWIRPRVCPSSWIASFASRVWSSAGSAGRP